MEERDFRQGAFKIEDGKAKEIEDLLRYFSIEGKPIRALRFDPNILAANRDKLKNRTLFMKNLPKDLIESELHEKLSKYGKITSCKIAKDKEYNSKGYGMVTTEDDATYEKLFKNPLQSEERFKDMQMLEYRPRDKRNMKTAVNTIFIKNFAPEWKEE